MCTFRHSRSLCRAAIVVVLSLVAGCGDETSRMAESIDLPKKEHAQPTAKSFAKTKSNAKTPGP